MDNKNTAEKEIDLIGLSLKVWYNRVQVIKIVGVFIAIGLFVAIFSPAEYGSKAILIPEVPNQGQANQLLRSFGGALGLGGFDLSQLPPGSISPLIYPNIVNSMAFQKQVLHEPIHFDNYHVRTTIADFYENHYSPSLLELIKEFTIGLPYKIIDLFRSKEEIIYSNGDLMKAEFLTLTKDELDLIENLQERIMIELDEDTGLLSVGVTLQDPKAAAELNQVIINLLMKYTTEYRIEKAQQNLNFVREQHAEAQKRFEKAQMNLANFRDRNVTLTSAKAQTDLERLQDEKELSFTIYKGLSQQFEQAKFAIQEQTPVFKILQPVTFVDEKIKPRRGLIVVIFTILGFLIGCIWVSTVPFLKKHLQMERSKRLSHNKNISS